MMIDSHAHYKDSDEVKKVLPFLSENLIVVMGTNIEDNTTNVNLCNNNKNMYFCLGIHPSNPEESVTKLEKMIEKEISNPKFVGVGEVGIDLYWRQDNLEEQIDLFKNQIKLAKKYKKTIVIHSRDSLKEIFDVLKNENIGTLPIILHCYSGDIEFYNNFKRNFNVKFGIGGVITYKNDRGLRDFVFKTPIEDLLVETDSPYLSPVPYRGKENTSNNLHLIISEIAKIKGLSVDKVIEITTKNAIYQFDLNI